MTKSRWPSLGLGVLLALVGAPLSFLAGVYAMGALMIWKSGPVGGEALQGAAFSAFLFGGPIGLVVGSVLLIWLGYWLAMRYGWPALAAAFVALAASSAFAMTELGLT